MRIPSNRLQYTMTHALNDSLERIERVQMELATGKRVQKPSDDPPGTMRILSFRRSLDRNRQYQNNAADGLRWLTATEAAVTDVTEILVQMKETAVRGASELPEDRAPLGTAVDSLLRELIDKTKTKIDSRYVLSGFLSYTEPATTSTSVTDEGFTAGAVGVEVDLENARIAQGSMVVTDASNTVTFVEGTDYEVDYDRGRIRTLAGGAMSEGTAYLADYETETVSTVTLDPAVQGDVLRQVDPNRTAQVNMLASDVFTGAVDVFQLAIDLKNALWKDDGAAADALIDSLDAAIDDLTESLGTIGAKTVSLENHQSRLENEELDLVNFISEIEGADMPAAVVRLQAEQTAYEAALAATGRLMQISLINYL